MSETFIPLKVPGGIYRNGTTYQSTGRWFDANLVRFVDGNVVKPIGGWRRAPDAVGANIAALSGVPRAAMSFLDDSGSVHLMFGTTAKLYALAGGVLADVSPVDLQPGIVDSTVPGDGTPTASGASPYGNGPYGSGPYAQGSTLGVRSVADTWQLDIFNGQPVSVSTSDGRLLVWDLDSTHPAASPLAAPSGNRGVVVTPENFLVALGANGNARRVQWASQDTFNSWAELSGSTITTAGNFDLVTHGRLVCGRRTRRETLLFTDTDVHSMTFIGGVFVYRFDQAGDSCGIIAPNAVSIVDTQAVWMGQNAFFTYDGFVRPLPSDVHDYVFRDMNRLQAAKIWSMPVAQHGEVWFFYPSSSSTECDRYVIYNYRENHWSIGQLARSCGVDVGAASYPIMCAPTGEVYEHEHEGGLRDTTPYIESGPVELSDGNRVMRVQSIVPDERTLGDVQASFYTSLYPNDVETVTTVNTATPKTDVRLTARQVRMRLTEQRAADWRVGTFRLGVIPGGVR